ncbi:MAG: hypothetical protein EI684_04815 [Candidatus Viridilinea halotolerans]|uniref:HEAT repeat domain-containing protein n=1 Tax=Candidatus Viridilinea halotolerans TaxID=2491704 RepID=A0A426U5U1_9CHLR|nr:MAG: hypothetical protein EI684_04815 [Candidatus Viridilinea halotolerans]
MHHNNRITILSAAFATQILRAKQSSIPKRKAVLRKIFEGYVDASLLPMMLDWMVTESCPGVSRIIAGNLGAFGSSSVLPILELLASSQFNIVNLRPMLLKSLSVLHKEALPIIQQALQDKCTSRQLGAITAVVEIFPRNVRLVLPLLRHAHWHVRLESVKALGLSSDLSDVAPLLDVMRQDRHGDVRLAACVAIQAINRNVGRSLQGVTKMCS